jgi:serine-type D-Ala-D-Ala carboxypeptidase/endopeptidase (penicillin-binding protein 4)
MREPGPGEGGTGNVDQRSTRTGRKMNPRRSVMRGVAAAAVVAGGAIAAATEAGETQARGPLQAQADAIVGTRDAWSILAVSMDRGDVICAVNPENVRVMASNNKVYSAIWALDALGPDYRFPTDLLVTGPLEDGVLRGDVVIRGSGDPAFGYRPYESGDYMRPLRNMAQSLADRGVRVIEGGVIGDATVFDRRHYLPSWPNDTQGGMAAYAPTVSGLPFQRNLLIIEMKAAPGAVVVEVEPDVPEIPVVSTAAPGGRLGFGTRRPDDDTVRVRGSAPGGSRPHRFGVGVNDAAIMTTGALRNALREAGIEVRGPVRLGPTPEGAVLVHRHHSIPLRDMIPQLNRHSDNFFAEHLWKAAAAATVGEGSFGSGPMASANFFHERAGVPYGQLWQADGSGLSRLNHSSAHALVQSLRYSAEQPWFDLFHESLAVAADRGGSMRRMYVGQPGAGRIHAKTGYIHGVRTLSGYVNARGGETIAFSFLYNGGNTGGARNVQHQLGNLLAEFSR